MAKKKSVRKTSKKVAKSKSGTKKKVLKNSRSAVQPIIRPVHVTSKKFNIAFKNFAIFLILTLVSLALYYSTVSGSLYNNLFYIISIFMGVVTLALAIIILVLLFLKILGK